MTKLKTVTIKDVAKAAGVSYATVSRALSGSTEIGEKTRARIVDLAREMGYTPNSIARSMIRKRTDTLGLVIASIDNPFMSELANHIEVRARERGYSLMVCNAAYDTAAEREALELLIGKQVDGVILFPSASESYEALQPLLDRVPVVFLSEAVKDRDCSYVSVDNYKGTVIGTEYLYSLGHRKVAYLGCRKNSVTHTLRVQGFTDTCERLGMECSVIYSNFGRSNRQAGYLLGKHYFSRDFQETAFFCSSDDLAIGVMQAADERGLRIPEDISLIGFDNISFTALPRISLTTIQQPIENMATEAVDMLIDRIADADASENCRVLTPVLVERRSCGMLDTEVVRK